jgi:hypothetical protein
MAGGNSFRALKNIFQTFERFLFYRIFIAARKKVDREGGMSAKKGCPAKFSGEERQERRNGLGI